MARVRRPTNTPTGSNSEMKTIAVIAVVLLLGVAYWWANREEAADASPDGEAALTTPSTAAYALPQPAHGSAEASAVLVKFTDFQ